MKQRKNKKVIALIMLLTTIVTLALFVEFCDEKCFTNLKKHGNIITDLKSNTRKCFNQKIFSKKLIPKTKNKKGWWTIWMISYTKRYVNIVSFLIATLVFILIINLKISIKQINFNPTSILNEFKRKIVFVELSSNNINQNTKENIEIQNNQNTNQINQKLEITKENTWKIVIPKISLEAEISEGTSKEVMNKYVGHFEETSLKSGNIGLAAHNRGYTVNYFGKIKELKQGDTIIYKYNDFENTYIVKENKIIKDTDWSYLEQTEENKITLITCVENQSEYRRCIQGIEKSKGGNWKIIRLRKTLVVISIFILNIVIIFNSVKATKINSTNIISGGDCGKLLTYKGITVKTYYAQYIKEGISYPAYCLDKTKHGVDSELSYSVSVENAISDVKLWRIIINGYPYKKVEELGCENKEEAFTATKQAIYCYIHGNNPSDYKAIGKAGERTLNALKQILSDAENCTDTQISNTVQIIKEKEIFEVDNIEKEYVSKTYSIKASSAIKNYKVELRKENAELAEGIKITDLNNKSKTEFAQNEKFKILIPIKNMREENRFNIEVKTQIDTKPVLYGKAPNNSYQDYALTAETYEDAKGNTQDIYYKNETKVKIIKQDAETQERLENVEFNILDENKNIIFSNIKTNEQGEIKIENLNPGKYYIQETNTKDGYLLNEELLEIDILFNEELTITINNLFEKRSKPQTIEKEKTETVVKKLPVTGM